jgi:hypothetical protein
VYDQRSLYRTPYPTINKINTRGIADTDKPYRLALFLADRRSAPLTKYSRGKLETQTESRYSTHASFKDSSPVKVAASNILGGNPAQRR